MSFSFLNPFLLFGLIGIGVPILIHLFSRKSATVVEWGAMQFLELGKRTKRRYRLEHLILLLMRILMVCLLVLAFARPWSSGLALWGGTERSARDVVFILDSSFSMNQKTTAVTPFNQARQWISQYLKQHQSGDHYYLIASHDVPRRVLPEWTPQPSALNEKLKQLPPASGSSDLPSAILAALQKMNTAQQPDREIIILTDQQAASWRLDQDLIWERIRNFLTQVPEVPRIWVVNFADESAETVSSFQNCSLAPIQLSRQTSLLGTKVQIYTRGTLWGGSSPVTRTAVLKINGQALQAQTQQVVLQPGKPVELQFEHTFSESGSHLVSVEWEQDQYPGDDLVSAVVAVQDTLSILLVEGTPNADPTLQETFFLNTALSPGLNNTNAAGQLLQTNIIEERFLEQEKLEKYNLVCLANVSQVTETHSLQIREYVKSGGALLVLLGDQVDPEAYQKTLFSPSLGVVQGSLQHQQVDRSPQFGGTHIDNPSLSETWLRPFQSENEGGLTNARFERWWVGQWVTDSREESDEHLPGWPRVVARLESGDPWLLSTAWGAGNVMLLTSPLDTAWSNLPTKPDYVPFVYELVLHLVEAQSSHNLMAGEPLFVPLGEVPEDSEIVLRLPAGEEKRFPVSLEQAAFQFTETYTSGLYTVELVKKGDAQNVWGAPARFWVGFSEEESNPALLDEGQRLLLRQATELKTVESLPELLRELLSDTQRTEFTTCLLVLFIMLLLGETYMTRRLVQGGHLLEEASPREAVS